MYGDQSRARLFDCSMFDISATNGNTEENDAISHNGDDASSVFPFGPSMSMPTNVLFVSSCRPVDSVSAPLSMTASVFDADQVRIVFWECLF